MGNVHVVISNFRYICNDRLAAVVSFQCVFLASFTITERLYWHISIRLLLCKKVTKTRYPQCGFHICVCIFRYKSIVFSAQTNIDSEL